MKVFDLFCGCGGASTGLVGAASHLGRPVTDLLAVNHWDKAVETHRRNHPWARVLHEDVSRVDPLAHLRPGTVQLGLAGPSCTQHSRARGGKPINDQERTHAWDVIRWAKKLEPESLLIENVPEFRDWSPVDAEGKIIASRKGEYFREFLAALRRLGYNVDHRVLCAAHYGDATTRRRLFVQARRGRITWPEPSHRLADEAADLFDLPTARSAREIIDWNLPGESIWTRKRPLADKTMQRIVEGLRRFAGGPFIIPQMSGGVVRTVDDPLPTLTGTSCARLVEPFLLGIGGPSGRQRASKIDDPLGTVLGVNHTYVVDPFVLTLTHGGRVRSIDEPLPTVTGANRGEMALIEPFIVALRSSGASYGVARPRSLDEPLATICAGANHFALIEPFLISYYGTGGAHSLAESLPTITGKDRFALVETIAAAMEQGVAVVADIRLRMLQPHELAAAHSFPSGYEFVGGKRDAVKMVGNSWPCELGKALCRSILEAQA